MAKQPIMHSILDDHRDSVVSLLALTLAFLIEFNVDASKHQPKSGESLLHKSKHFINGPNTTLVAPLSHPSGSLPLSNNINLRLCTINLIVFIDGHQRLLHTPEKP